MSKGGWIEVRETQEGLRVERGSGGGRMPLLITSWDESETAWCLFVGGAADGQWYAMREDDYVVERAAHTYRQETFAIDEGKIQCVLYILETMDAHTALTHVFRAYSAHVGYQGTMGEA